ncbi:MAG: response regulator [Lentisphaerae bacterium]|nr:response regulator [Lentisphaerota bacterium]
MKAKKIILLVDDDTDLVEANKELLQFEGFEVHVAYDGKTGLQKAREIRPNLMILDVMMAHDTEGFDISRDVRKIPELKNMAVIILTGIKDKKHLPFCFEPDEDWLPVKAVLEKPVPPKTLVAEVRKYLA